MTVARTEVAGGSHPVRAVPVPRLLLREIEFRDQLEIVTGASRRWVSRGGERQRVPCMELYPPFLCAQMTNALAAVRRVALEGRVAREQENSIVLPIGHQSRKRGRYSPNNDKKGGSMADQISPKFHAEIILEFFNEYRDLRKVSERAAILLSSVSSGHLDAVGRYLPKDLVRVLPRRMPRAA